MDSRNARLPWALGACLAFAVVTKALDPAEQLYYRDTLRCAYHFKQFIAAQLHQGQSPFWDPWTESGTSVLVQITPGLFHPATLLYLFLPLELAFKLNHLLAVPLAWAGLHLLSRKLGATAWGAAAGACGYAACGYLPSVVSSNLHYALAAATMPLALHAFLRFAGHPRPLRLLWAGYALALCFYGGEPQSMLLTGFLGALYLLIERRKSFVRALGVTAAWGGCALLLAAPAVLPVLARLRASPQWTGRSAELFVNTPARLFGLLVPWAFDDSAAVATYREYFGKDAFIDCIVVGAPILLLAAASGKRGRWVLACGLVFVLGSAGASLGVLPVLDFVIPGLSLFRYPEKLIAPASMLLCLAAAFGASRLEESAGRRVKLFAAAAAALALSFAAVRLGQGRLVPWLQAHGAGASPALARAFAASLGLGLLCETALAALLAVIALFASGKRASMLAAILCAGAGFLQTRNVIETEPLTLAHAPLLLAEQLKRIAGPSEGRWRVRADDKLLAIPASGNPRRAHMEAEAQMLQAPFPALARVEGIDEYTSLGDLDYSGFVVLTPKASNQLLGVRFDVQSIYDLSAQRAAELGDRAAGAGAWVKEFPERPRAFLASCALSVPGSDAALRWLGSPRFRIGEAVVRADLGLPCPAPEAGSANLQRPSPAEMRLKTDSRARALLVVSEHYDPGWQATLDGNPAPVVQVDLAALGVVVPEGKHEVRLHFLPQFLLAGLLLCGGCVLGLLLLELLHRDDRVGAAKAE